MALYEDPEQARDAAYSSITGQITTMGFLVSNDDMPMSLRMEARRILQDMRTFRDRIPRHFSQQTQGG